MTMPVMEKANTFFQQSVRSVQPYWFGLLAGVGVLGCASSPAAPNATPVTYLPHIPNIAVIQNAITKTKQKPVIERVDDFRQYPETIAEPSGPLNLLPTNDPLAANAKIRGVQVPLVANNGTSKVYPVQRGGVSFYHEGQDVATGEGFNPAAMTAAHKNLPFGTLVRCTRLDNGQSVIVMINDRGPYVKGRILDVSKEAARKLGMVHDGVVNCLVEVLAYPLVETMGPRGNG
jgi:rare lipoprotein A